MELRVHLCASASMGVKEKAVKGILENEDVIAHWDDISWSWGRQEAEQLLQMIIIGTTPLPLTSKEILQRILANIHAQKRKLLAIDLWERKQVSNKFNE